MFCRDLFENRAGKALNGKNKKPLQSVSLQGFLGFML
jgi:hypothetical protein